MSIFGTIMSKIFHHGDGSAATATAGAPAAVASAPSATADAASTTPDTAVTPMTEVDVEAVLTDMAAQYNHPVNWRYSIVDLMAMLGMDNSLAQRKELAQELGYTGDMNDSATMNIWLHKQVMQKLADNGGKVPADLLK
ncbi:MAG TPA: DUF3597 domain-containing protein [Candidatus Elarobacter sp.]|nr:DUF3597 domain-containing protein [Candidatus Elarobacter sp.]